MIKSYKTKEVEDFSRESITRSDYLQWAANRIMFCLCLATKCNLLFTRNQLKEDMSI